MRIRPAYLGVLIVLLACGDDTANDGGTTGGGGPFPDPEPLPALAEAFLTTDQTLVPTHAVASGERNPAIVEQLNEMLSEGFGEVAVDAEQEVFSYTVDDSPVPTPGPAPKLLARFVHLADTQLADDESPGRLASVDGMGDISGAYRPQEAHECHILNAAVRTINRINEDSALDFVLLGGDNIDNAQQNELDWFQSIVDGSPRVECDSGDDDDPVSGPDNDPKDPFYAAGLDVPWRWVTGNHDILKQGNLSIDGQSAVSTGDYASAGARDWSQPGGPVIKGEIPPDPKRVHITRRDLLEQVMSAGDGHGIAASVVSYGKAYYTFDVEGTPLRIVVMDSASEDGGSDGLILQDDIDAFLEPALTQASIDGKLVIVTSHHASTSLSDGSGFGGTPAPGAQTADAFQGLLGQFDNVLIHLAAHSHIHRTTRIEPAGGNPYFELVTAALADFPHQMRVFEVWDQDNGMVMVRAIAFDYAVDDDPIAAEGRAIGVTDFTSGWTDDGRGKLEERNVELWFPMP